MARTIQHIRRTAKLLASFATLWAAFAATTVWMAPVTDPGRHVAPTAVMTLTPVLQFVLIGAGALRECSKPRRSAFVYFAAALLLVPELVMMSA